MCRDRSRYFIVQVTQDFRWSTFQDPKHYYHLADRFVCTVQLAIFNFVPPGLVTKEESAAQDLLVK